MTLHKAKTRIGNILTPRPNWAESVSEEYAFDTRIFTSRDGTEQRDAQRTLPRIAVEFTSDQTDTRAQRLLIDAQNQRTVGLFVLPVRWRQVALAADALAGATAITLDQTAPWWIAAGEFLVLESDGVQEAVEVGGISGTTINLAAPTQSDFAAGDLVILGLRGRLSEQNAMRAAVSIHKRFPLRFEVDPGTFNASPQAEYRAHEGMPICPVLPNWRDPVSFDTADMREVSDHKRGVIDVTYPKAFLDLSEQWTFTGMSRSKVDELIAFFHYVRGRQRPFYVSSQFADFTVATPASAGATTVIVAGREVAPAFASDPLHRCLVARFASGCVQFNRIDGYAFTGDDETVITVRDPWEEQLDANTQLSWGYLARLMNDRLTVNWVTDQVAEASIAIKAIPNDFIDLWVDPLTDDPLIYHEFSPTLSSVDRPWEQTWPYGEAGIEYWGHPLGFVDRALARMSIYCNTTITLAGGSQIQDFLIKVWFYNENGTQIGTFTDDEASWSWSWANTPVPLVLEHTVNNVPIPAGTRLIRVRCGTARGSQIFSCNFYIESKNWGPIRDMENKKCL